MTKVTPVPNAKAETFNIAAVTGLGEHKELLLDHLRKTYDRGPKANPFDAEKAWRQIEVTAQLYLVRNMLVEERKRTKVNVAQRYYRKIADTLKAAHALIAEAQRSDYLSVDLAHEWETTADRSSPVDQLVRIKDEFNAWLASLDAFAKRMREVSDELRQGPGRPGISRLPHNFVHALAVVYRDATGIKPGAGWLNSKGYQPGPFVRFVRDFMIAVEFDSDDRTAVDRSLKDHTIVNAIKATRSRAKQNKNKWGPSPFDDD